jgi:hypothetical protein
MSPDTNNNIGNEVNDETDDDDEEEEDQDEPVFKFSTITSSSGVRKTNDNSKSIPSQFSCIAVHEKFIVIGKTTGEIVIMDHMGNTIPQYQIKGVSIREKYFIIYKEFNLIGFSFFYSIHIQ